MVEDPIGSVTAKAKKPTEIKASQEAFSSPDETVISCNLILTMWEQKQALTHSNSLSV